MAKQLGSNLLRQKQGNMVSTFIFQIKVINCNSLWLTYEGDLKCPLKQTSNVLNHSDYAIVSNILVIFHCQNTIRVRVVHPIRTTATNSALKP